MSANKSNTTNRWHRWRRLPLWRFVALCACLAMGCNYLVLDRHNWACQEDRVCNTNQSCKKPCEGCIGRCRWPHEDAPCLEKVSRPCSLQGEFAGCPGTQVCTQGFWGLCQAPAHPTQPGCVTDRCDSDASTTLERPCYTGPTGTKGVGACVAGKQLCQKGRWGPCEGQILPQPQDLCGSRQDENCDGIIRPSGRCAWVSAPQAMGHMTFAPRMAGTEGRLFFTGSIAPQGDQVQWGGQQWTPTHQGSAMFVTEVNTAGVPQWLTFFPSPVPKSLTEGQAIARDSKGNLYIAGRFDQALPLWIHKESGVSVEEILKPQGQEDIFLLKMRPDRTLAWALSAGGPNQDSVADIHVDAQGHVLVTGHFTFHFELLSPSTKNLYKLESIGDTDIFLLKLSSDGEILWLHQYGGKGSDRPGTGGALATDRNAGIYLAGQYGKGDLILGPTTLPASRVGPRGFVAHLDSAGKVLWAKGTQGDGRDQGVATSIVALQEHDTTTLTVAGTYQGEIEVFSPKSKLPASQGIQDDIFVAQLNADGDVQWSRASGGTGLEVVSGMALRQDGTVVVIGHFFSKGRFGNTTLNAANVFDIFLLQWTAKGVSQWALSVGSDSYDYGAAALFDAEDQLFVLGRCRGNAPIQLQGISQDCFSENQGQWFIWKHLTLR